MSSPSMSASAGDARRRARRWALAFWVLLAAGIAADWAASRPHNRFAEPPPWAINQAPGNIGAHCASAPARK